MGNRAGNRYTLGQGGGRGHPLHGYTTGAGTKPPTTHMHIKQQEEKPNTTIFFFYNNRQNCRDVSIYFCISISLSLSLFLRIENFLQHLVKEFWDFGRWVVLGAMEEVVGR